MVEFTADVTQGSPLSGYLGLARENPRQPSPKAAAVVGWTGSREGNGARRGQVKRGNPPSSTNKGIVPCAGRKLELLASLNKSLNPTRCMSKRKIV